MTGTKGLAVAASVVALLAGAGIANAQTASNFTRRVSAASRFRATTTRRSASMGPMSARTMS